jgi:hypothetical protein
MRVHGGQAKRRLELLLVAGHVETLLSQAVEHAIHRTNTDGIAETHLQPK